MQHVNRSEEAERQHPGKLKLADATGGGEGGLLF